MMRTVHIPEYLLKFCVTEQSQNVLASHISLNTENHLGNIDLEEVELIYVEVTYAPKDFSDDFREFAEFNLEGLNMDNESLDAAAGLDLFYF